MVHSEILLSDTCKRLCYRIEFLLDSSILLCLGSIVHPLCSKVVHRITESEIVDYLSTVTIHTIIKLRLTRRVRIHRIDDIVALGVVCSPDLRQSVADIPSSIVVLCQQRRTNGRTDSGVHDGSRIPSIGCHHIVHSLVLVNRVIYRIDESHPSVRKHGLDMRDVILIRVLKYIMQCKQASGGGSRITWPGREHPCIPRSCSRGSRNRTHWILTAGGWYIRDTVRCLSFYFDRNS